MARQGRRIVLGVGGGIAAYKAVAVLRLLSEAGHDVHVVPTPSALRFVGAPTWESLAGHAVHTDVFTGAAQVEHVALGRSADLVVVAPATADLLARAAHGHADDLLTATLLTVTCPVLVAPAMHTEMWLHAATRANVATLRERGVAVLDPDDGRLAGADSGPGRLPEPEAIVAAALALLTPTDLAGVRAVVSAGGTREPVDPVRFLGNRGTGRQGVAVAAELARRGADVTLVAANVEIGIPPGVAVVPVTTALELEQAMRDAAGDADVVVMSAAVADFRPSTTAPAKVKKADGVAPPTIELVTNPDVLAGLVAARHPGQVIVGFAAETGDDAGSVLDHGRAKARRKGADLLAVNAVGTDQGFGDVPNAVVVLDAAGDEVGRAGGSKADVARGLVDLVAARITGVDTGATAPTGGAASDTLAP
ncbi:phosphopantothenoylcysteine decarboxylase/phosphopantothenate/cysteine ligase [Beutenbergia cavernae DSM 12333]|uniref:Coenzyme A biosynthesis bifunctional protein CoaBC n=1 Tax=Beutenbergia cavernae (strain ATCC BAA-8 / DSM 12333 / CCUG 43141 / JCM 11478 / NBRC 16432 / NCIMB 13614 / HKI 0122) TaxID=471853 RepID=C5C693_BEUC1|nr:bifunctional phosphopantothenoylcysteine decarboxylase/phosphopantothenate--cysteine ligase CoaBC [Beutenbergia cavernae]ACQ80299.1 phosphopantothenoylcysteine decarboxylase/phosphopantothenate/cysteine ligase [Beutenbergia cavernae DSM 12333]